ncbi:MAG: histidine phosphatase family protein [Acidobacteria bacterium]|nr:histidine phosphatase family protein [Acidobacteriota bacterium]
MKTLLLLRHAKSDWADMRQRDIERPLAKRGLRDAPRMGAALKQQGIAPQLVLCSPATRARETMELFTTAAELEAVVEFEPTIYEASAAELLKLVRHIKADYEVVLLVGHNPGFENLLSRLIGAERQMPTAALACIEFAIDQWQDVEDGKGKLLWFLIPKMLES